MYGTMQDFPLTITAIMRHGCGVHGRRTVTTATGEGYRHSSYRDVGQRAGQLANALRRLGVTGDQRVATFMWNNTEHLVTYFAVPSMGAVLHTLNIRLFPEQIAYVTNEAEDRVILVDLSLARLLAPVLPKLDTVHTVIAVGEGDTTPLREAGKTVLRFAELIDAESPTSGGRRSMRTPRPQCVTPAVLPAIPKALYTAIVRAFCTRWRPAPQTVSGSGPVTRCCRSCRCFMPTGGATVCGLDGGCGLGATRSASRRPLADPHGGDAEADVGRRGANHLERRHALPREGPRSRHVIAASGRLRRIGGSGIADAHLRGQARCPDSAAVGHDGNIAAGHHGLAATWHPGRPALGIPHHSGPTGVRGGDPIVDDDGQVLPNDGNAVGEVEVRGPWIAGSYYGDVTSPSSIPAGCAPVTSAASTSKASSP